jgi:hypothetical protein
VLTNSGSIISATLTNGNASGIYSSSSIGTLTNSGSIRTTSTNGNAFGISLIDSIDTLTNSGSISSSSSIGSASGISLNDSVGTLTNSGSMTVTAATNAEGIFANGRIETLTNSGSISVTSNEQASGIIARNFVNTFINSGSISATGGAGTPAVGFTNGGNIENFSNSGTIIANTSSGPAIGVFNWGGTITNLTNTGSISKNSSDPEGAGILNAGTIVNLNNAQGGNGSSSSTTALTLVGNLPRNYNIIINSATHYGQLSASAPGETSITNFGIYGAPFLTSRTYSNVLSGEGVRVEGTSSGTYDNMRWALVPNGADVYDLTFTGASLMGTQQSLVNTANALAPIYAMQNAVLVNSFTYDCTLFDVNNICISVGGRNTQVSDANGLNSTSALLIAAYRLHPNYRIGAYADQNLSVNNAGSTVSLTNSTPLIGIFGAWTQNQKGTGAEVRVSAAYGQKDATINRQVVGLSEPGSGSSTLNSQGAQITAKYGFGMMDKVIVSPYVGVRYTQNNMNGYTEGSSATVTAPLTYSALNTSATTALAGVGASYKVIPTVTTFASTGVESDVSTSNGNFLATGINGLTPVNFNPNPVRTRPTATLGAYYDIAKNQRFGVTGIYRQEAYQAVSSTTVMAIYTIGL